MGMLYPPSSLSHHISLQLMLQREFHVITLGLLSRPHERGRGKGDRGTETGTEGEKMRERKTIKSEVGCHVKVACQLHGPQRGRCGWWLVECMLGSYIIVAEHNQTGASEMELTLTAVITHRHGEDFWPAVDGRRRPLLQAAFKQIGMSVVRETQAGRILSMCTVLGP